MKIKLNGGEIKEVFQNVAKTDKEIETRKVRVRESKGKEGGPICIYLGVLERETTRDRKAVFRKRKKAENFGTAKM